MFREQTKVLENIAINDSHRLLKVYAPKSARAAEPGQFAELATSGATLLRKPISIASVDGDELTFVYRIIGNGTKALAALQPGNTLDIIAPLGKGFYLLQKKALLIGGGVGVPPLWFLSQKLLEKGVPVIVVTGARTKTDLLLQKELAALGPNAQVSDFSSSEFADASFKVAVATDDGSCGVHGTVIDVLEKIGPSLSGYTAYACGPQPMLRALFDYSKARGLSLQVCMEAYMGCGFGVCVGCALPTLHGMKRVCKDGPVFNAEEILWDKIH